MIFISICDDSFEFAADLEKLLEAYFENISLQCQIDTYLSGQEFLNKTQSSSVDILFLDIMLGQESGIDIGAEVRNISHMEDTLIIYVSSVEQYTRKLIQTRPMEYLCKPVQFQELKTVLDFCLHKLNKKDSYITVSYKRNTYNIRIKDIVYIESNGRFCEIFTRESVIKCYAKLQDLKEMIIDSAFIEVHKSYLINFAQVAHYSYEEVTLQNGATLAISQKRRKDVRNKYLLYTQGGTNA